MKPCPLVLAVMLSLPVLVSAQSVQISRENKTISVNATETVRVDADLAIVSLGYQNHARSKDQAFKENVAAADRIIRALRGAGLADDQIETESIRMQQRESLLGFVETKQSGKTEPEERIEAEQKWKIRVASADAEKVVDVAVKAGANMIDEIEWAVADMAALETAANAAALARAQSLAGKIAEGFGVKAGELLYVSNSEPESYGVGSGRKAFFYGALAKEVPPPDVKLFPKRVSHRATVYAVFALE